jgi:hypothetical protein
MASYAEAYGYTPDQFMSLTLPNLTHFGEHARKQAESMESASSGKSGYSSANTGSIGKSGHNNKQGKWKSGTSIESLIGMYGDPESKKNIMNEALGQPPKETKE